MFASCEKHVKNEKDKNRGVRCMILEVASWQSFSLLFFFPLNTIRETSRESAQIKTEKV
jgi:hypothetical protein